MGFLLSHFAEEIGLRWAAAQRNARERGVLPQRESYGFKRAEDGRVILSSDAANTALDAKKLGGRATAAKFATFDLSPEILEAIKDGRMLFAVDQQAYLQGYMPIVMLTQQIRYGLFPAMGQIVSTGPNFVTKENAALALRTSARGLR